MLIKGFKSVFASIVFIVSLLAANHAMAASVAVISHSVSTDMESDRILAKTGWSRTSSLRYADGILVVCRSELYDPLNYSYSSVKELDNDADMQLNISGSNYCVYVYSIEDDLSVRQIKHVYYKAED